MNSAGAGTQNYGNFGGVDYATLANWQTANGGIYDANSRQADPLYTSPGTGNFLPTSVLTNNVGSYIGVGYDINGTARSTVNPDPGAYEYTLFGLDAGIVWVSPSSPTTPGLQTITVNITNYLSTPITDLVLSYTDGGTPVTQTFSGLNIITAGSQNFSFTTQYNLTGFASMRAYINSVNGITDNVQLDDTTAYQSICYAMNGAYTINSGAAPSVTNFQSFTSFAAALNCGGVSGPVTVNVVSGSGPYVEQVSINQIAGASGINTVTINGNNTTLTFPSGVFYYTLRLNGADYMTWNNLNIATSGTTNGIALNMTNASDNNNFNNCTFTVPLSATSTTTSCVAFSGSPITATTAANNGSNNTFSGCTMSGGYYCVSVNGNSTGNIVGNQFLNCNIKEYYIYGLYQTYASFTVVRDCIFERPVRTTTTTCYGVAFSTGSSGCLVERNRIRNMFGGTGTTTGTFYGLYCIIAATAGNENRFINNVISDINFNGSLYGIYFSAATFVKAYHNTVSLDHTACTGTAATYGIYSTGAASVDIQNNLVTISRGGTGTKYCAYYTTMPTTTNYNDFFINSAAGVNYIAYDGVTNFATLAAYQTGQPAKDQLSVSLNPNYNNPATFNYKPTEATLDNLGSNVGVGVDITGAVRGAIPDIGAYDFTVYPADLTVVSFVSPGNSGCYSAAENIVVTLKNNGSQPIDFSLTPATVTCDVTGAVTTSLVVNLTGTLASGATTNVTFPALNMTTNGTYSFNIYSTLAGDGDMSNNALSPAVSRIVGPVGGTVVSGSPSLCVTGTPSLTLSGHYGGAIQWQQSNVSATGPWTNVGTGTAAYTPASPITVTTFYRVEISCNGNTANSNTYTVTVNNPVLTSTTPGTRCGYGSVVLGATAATGTPTWYATATGGTPLGTGSTFNTPNISATTNFYVASAEGGGGGTSVTPMPALGTPFSGNVRGYWFTAPSDFTITGLQVPLTGATQSMAVIKFVPAVGPPSFSTVTNAFTTLYLTQNNTNTGVLPVNIPIAAGEVIGIFGQMGTNSAYAATTGVVNTTINGQTVALTRMGMQFPLGTTAPQDVWQEVAAAIGVVNITYTTGCEGPRVAVAATITPSPSMTVTTADPILCPGLSTTVNVSSPNDPNYTYTWTSVPAGFTATGAGPHAVAPTTTTKYFALAQDNTAGPNAGCARLDSVTVNTAATLSAGTVSVNTNSFCISGTPIFSVAGATGGTLQWQVSAVSAAGPWTNVGTGANTYTPASPVTQTSYYRVQASCLSSVVQSNVVTVTISNPQILSTTPGTRCGVGSVTLSAVPDAGVNVKWYSTATGGTSLFSGSSFATPTIASTTTFYAEPLVGIGGADSVAIPITTAGTTPIYHNMFLITSPTGMTVNSFGLKCNNTIGTLTGWDVYYRTDNYQLVAGANTSSAGWILLSSATGIPSVGTADYTFIMTGQALVIPPGATYSFYVAPAAGSTHQYVTNAIGTTIASNANASIISGNRGSTLFNCTTSGGCPILKVKYSLGCVGTRVPVLATVTPPPAMTVTAADLTLCPGGSTTVSVSSPNNPNYTYSWTSNPAGFTASGAGPHNVTPTVTTKYIVLAQDNSAGPNAGCANLDSVSVITSTVFSAGTVSSTLNTICVSATPTLSVAGLSGGSIQWQDSSSLTSGLWVNVGTGATTYVPASPVNVTTYFRVQATCQTTNIYSNTLMVTVNSPQITSSTPGTRCGYGSLVLNATPEPGATLKWFSTPTGGAPLYTGSPFTTPAIASTTTFYAEASTGGGGGNASPIQVTELDLGGSDRLEIQNVSPDPINVTGWKVVVSNSYTDITSVNANIQTLSGTMNPGATLSWTDATAGPNYWGSNILWNPGVYPTFTGWAAILDNNNVLKDIVFMNWPATNIAAANITVGATVITVGTQWTGAGIDITTVAATNSVSRQGTSDNNNLSDFAIIPLSIGSTNPGMTIPFTGFGCQGIRVPVIATVTPPPAMTVTATATTLCAGQSTTLSVNSPNDPNYTYNWNPGNLTGSSVTVTPGATTIYTLTAIDNTAGAFAGCGNVSTVTITVNPVLVDLAPTASPSSVCQGNNVNLTSNATATLGYSMNPSSSVAFVNISATGTDIDLPANLQDDSEHNIAIPSFTFNGVTYTTARVAMNGVVVLGSTTGDVTAGNGPLPSTANTAGNIFLAPYWDDLYPIAGVASVKTQTIGSNFIIQWTNATHFDDSISGNITFQVQLNLTSGVITYVYNDVTFGNPLMDAGINATVGIQMGAASALQYSSGTASLTAGQSISFIPNSVSVDWAGPNGYSSNSVNPVLNPATILNNGTYTVTATGNNGCTKTATVNLVILPCSSTLNLTCFIEGYWDGTSAMVPVLANQGETSASTACDSIDVELHDAASPFAMVQSVRTLLNQDGTATCVFPAVSGSYYIVVKNRSMVAAWSAAPVAMSAIPTSYNFTTAESQVYGAGGFPAAMKEVSSGVWAFYSGDIVVDENVDLLDLGLLETDISDFAFGYQYLTININYPGIISTDLNGDGNVDLLDSPILEDNISNFIFSNHP
ncbi:hypothetical protein EMGBS15_17020 [Filimonas sp.]|nr:hypothetical protein EMGBS15_17020 [Filimonas sp.]